MTMSQADKLLTKMQNNPKGDWTPANLKTIAKAKGLTCRQNGTSHAVFTNKKGEHLTVPMHKPVKAIYIKKFIALAGG